MLTKTGEQHHTDSWVLHDDYQLDTKNIRVMGKVL